MNFQQFFTFLKGLLIFLLAQVGIELDNDVRTNVSDIYTDHITLQLYWGEYPGNYTNIPYKKGLTLEDYDYFNASHKTIFYFPGWGEIPHAGDEMFLSIRTLVTGFRQMPDTNLVVFDYLAIQRYPNYYSAIANASEIGVALAQFFDQYIPFVQSKDQLHFIGHSLGCQVIADTARSYKALGNSPFSRLTGLDPAIAGSSLTYLKASDGDYVDIIFTSVPSYGGLAKSYGTINFYPNGGTFQPFCFDKPTQLTCNHAMAWKYYFESMFFPTDFPSKRCSELCKTTMTFCFCDGTDIAYMAYEVNLTKKGHYFLKTSGMEPYGLGARGIQFGTDLNKK